MNAQQQQVPKVSTMHDVDTSNLPIVLGCGHTFSSQALKKVLEHGGDVVHCPECNTPFQNNHEILESHHLLLSHLVHQGGKHSKQCKIHHEQFDFYCFDCEYLLCKECLNDEKHQFHVKKTIKELRKMLFSSLVNLYEIEGEIIRVFDEEKQDKEAVIERISNELIDLIRKRLREKLETIIQEPKISKESLLSQIQSLIPEEFKLAQRVTEDTIPAEKIQGIIQNINNSLTDIQNQIDEVRSGFNLHEVDKLRQNILYSLDELVGYDQKAGLQGNQFLTPNPDNNNKSFKSRNHSKVEDSCNLSDIHDEFHNPFRGHSNNNSFRFAPMVDSNVQQKLLPQFKSHANSVAFPNNDMQQSQQKPKGNILKALEEEIDEMRDSQDPYGDPSNGRLSQSMYASTGSLRDSAVSTVKRESSYLKKNTIIQNHEIKSPVSCLSWSNVKSYVAIGSEDGSIFIRRGHNQEAVANWKADSNKVTAIIWSFDDKQLVTCCQGYTTPIKIRQTKSWCLIQTLEEHKNRITCLTAHPSDLMFASGEMDGTVRFWSLKKYECLSVVERAHKKQAYRIKWSPDGKVVASATSSRVFVWKAENFSTSEEITAFKSDIVDMAWSRNSEQLIFAIKGTQFQVFDRKKGKMYTFEAHLENLNCVAVGFGQYFATSSRGKSIKVWKNGSFTCEMELKTHPGNALQLEWSPDQRYLCSGFRDGSLKVWKLSEKGLPDDDDKCNIF